MSFADESGRELGDLLAAEGGRAERRAAGVLRRAEAASAAGRHHDALLLLSEHASAFEGVAGDALEGRFRHLLARTYARLGASEGREDYLERAADEYAAAARLYARARHERERAACENDLALLLSRLGRTREAHERLDRAGATLSGLREASLLARVDATRARVFLAEQKCQEARRVIERAVRALEQEGGGAPLAEALAVRGVVLARLGDHDGSVESLRRASEVAERAGADAVAAHAALTLLEEHWSRRDFPQSELYDLYLQADELLGETPGAEDVSRLRACAALVMRRLSGEGSYDGGFSFQTAVHEFEAAMIEQALEEASGSVTQASRTLGLSHQTFTSMLERRHRHLRGKRTPREKRRRSIIRKTKA